MKLLEKARAIFDHFNDFLLWLAGVLLYFALFSVCYEIGMRYFLHHPTVWSLELTEYTLVWVTFLGTAWLLRREGHVKIDFLLLRLKPRVQTIINIVTSILCAIACLVALWYSGQVVREQFQRGLVFSTALALPMWPIFIILPIGFFLLFIQFLRRTYRYLASWRLPQVTEQS